VLTGNGNRSPVNSGRQLVYGSGNQALIFTFLLAGLSNTLKCHEILDIHDPLCLRCCLGREIRENKGCAINMGLQYLLTVVPLLVAKDSELKAVSCVRVFM